MSLSRAWNESLQRMPLVARNAPGAAVSESFLATLEASSDRQDWLLYRLIGHYSEMGRMRAAGGDVSEALVWFAKAERACASGRMRDPMLLALSKTHIRAAESYLAMACNDFDGAREKLGECIQLCEGYSESVMVMRLFHFGANLIRLESLRGEIDAGVMVATDMLLSRAGMLRFTPQRIYFGASQPQQDDVVLFQLAQLLVEVSLLEVVTPAEKMTCAAGFFLSSQGRAAMKKTPTIFQEWFELKTLHHEGAIDPFIAGVTGFLERDLKDLLVLRLLLVRDAAIVARDAALLHTLGDAIADCTMIPRLHRARLKSTSNEPARSPALVLAGVVAA